ncbi:unnamed protein product [Adineta steineri]|uniref:mRNA-capping enzyme n=1 Tax=Adineta steineri TaxID=433720 RepID=A0A815ML47_9BILA|nr:unnamed protein product [Adineta steineri]
MSNSPSFSSGIAKDEPDGILAKWLNCPTKSMIIDGKFVAFKTPIVHQNKDTIPLEKQWLCDMLIQDMKKDKKKLGLVIDLTNTKPRYTINTEYMKKNVDYRSILCQGGNEVPTDYQIQRFIEICNDFTNSNPNDIIGVHSTYGFNRTGFFICAYLCQQLRISIAKAIDLFAIARSPGISNQTYLDKLIQLYGNENIESNLEPSLPTWFPTAGLPESTTNERPHDDTNSEQGTEQTQHEIHTKSAPKLVADLADVIPIDSESADRIQLKCKQMCQSDQKRFSGSQPVSMDFGNYNKILDSPYKVSWKAGGTRYMMLIEDINEIYMIDCNNDVFKINYLWFPQDPNCTNHLKNTLLDGEFVTDEYGNEGEYRYYVYDIVYYNDENLSQQSFTQRMEKYQHIMNVRNEAVRTGHMDNRSEPFSVHAKDFWNISAVLELPGGGYQSKLLHTSDEIIFQPVNDPYTFGLAWRVLKWKKYHTIDFQLKITNEGQSQVKIAHLYLNNMEEPFRSMAYSSELDHYNNKIIECSYQNNQWVFYRHRSDKIYANAESTS